MSMCATIDYCHGWNDAVNQLVCCEECVYAPFCDMHERKVHELGEEEANEWYCADGRRD